MSVIFLNSSVVNPEFLEQTVIAATALAREKGIHPNMQLTGDQPLYIGQFEQVSVQSYDRDHGYKAAPSAKPEDYDI